jgi:hypothetical protein
MERGPRYIHYLIRCFFVPLLKISTSVLLRGIIGFTPPGAGLPVRDGGPEWMCDGTEEMRSEGLDVGRNGGEAEEACGSGLAAG